eukprot:SAG25_NODE_1148_length_3785_cov_17.808445_2_plen_76_part_00
MDLDADGAIRARLMLLKAWNLLVKQAIPLIDLRHFRTQEHPGHALCQCKGRVLPETAQALIDRAVRVYIVDLVYW